ncbi:hypothetical protein AX14_014105 [Amanita brunnescens Koide BX004]|nr:hypothetical protein AX14_014105 [Amanita brunnescens Koide BX004]
MVLSSSGPPGPKRPKSSSGSPSHSPSSPAHIFSPAPSKPSTSWFSLLASPAPSPIPQLPPTAVNAAMPLPAPHHVVVTAQPTTSLQSNLIDNTNLVTNISSSAHSVAKVDVTKDPWARAHTRVCAHANQNCSACSISLTCCSCRALHYTPGPPPSSPSPVHAPAPTNRSQSVSPSLFRDLGNPPSPAYSDWNDTPDDDAYARALAEYDTCDNSSCPHGADKLVSWTITVEQFDEGSEEFFDRTFRACNECNRSCKKSFMTYKIKARQFDNSSKTALSTARITPGTSVQQRPLPLEAPATESRPLMPLEAFSAVARKHRSVCSHPFTTCSTCSRGITCCQCNNPHTAPARLKLRCAMCSHYACAMCTTPFCCSCRKPWFPGDSPSIVLANRFRGGARSTKSSKKGSSSSSQSSGPGSLATAHSARNSPDPFVQAPIAVLPTQSSADEIDAFGDATIRVSEAAMPRDANVRERSVHAPSPSSNLPPGSTQVFSRPPLPVIAGATEDIPTAVPSRAPSRAASVLSTSSIGDAGIANEPQPPPFPTPVGPPAFNDVIGRIHRRFPLASLKVDDEDSRHFLAHDNTRVDDIANETDYLLSSHTSWPSILYFIRDTMKFESIQGPLTDFQVVLSGLAEIWSDAASFDAREVLRDMLDASRLLPKAEKEIDRLEGVSARYRSERQAARTQLKTTEAELSRLRQAANDTLDSNARLLTDIDQLQATDAVSAARERDEAQVALKDAIAHSKMAMAKQVSQYQHLAGIADERISRIQELEKEASDKDAYILKTEREHAEIYREREAAERLVTSLKQQLQEATSLFETTHEACRHDQEDFDERTASFKKHISELNAKLNLLPTGEAELRSLVTDANERAGIAEEECRKKSAKLKLANKEISALKAKQPKPTSTNKAKAGKTPAKDQPQPSVSATNSGNAPQANGSKKVRWGFEPSDDSSQPFWDHANEYSRYIADMVAAMVTALPNIPMQTAISSAIETVRAAGPTILSQQPKSPAGVKRSQSPKLAQASSASLSAPAERTSSPAPPLRRSRAPSPSTQKQSHGPATTSPGNMTFAQMAASVLDPPVGAPVHPAKVKPTWRAIETNKSLVLRPGTKGTRVSELHIRIPKVPATTHMFSLNGTKLINEILRLVNESHNKEGIRTLKENHIVLVKWSMRGNLIIKCSKPMDDTIKDCLHEAIKAAVPPSSTDSIAILNKPPTTALKFSSVPRHNEDGTDTDSYNLHNDLMANELWRDVEIFSQPRFLPMKPDAAGGTVIVSVVDDKTGSVGRKLMNSVVNFSGASRRCLRWVEKEAQLHCTQCQTWGHLNFNCLSNIMRCSKCSGPHDYHQHDRYCETCKAGKGHLCIPKCFNCRGAHFANSKDCIFYLNKSSKERQIQLQDEFSQKWKEEEAALKAAANTDSGRAARTSVAIKASKVDVKGKGKAGAQPRKPKDDDDFVPVGKGGKAKYTFGGMAQTLPPTTRIEEIAPSANDDNGNASDSSSELRLSYVDDIPLRQRFPSTKLPASKQQSSVKPLTITLPAPSSRTPLRSVTDILRELKNPSVPNDSALDHLNPSTVSPSLEPLRFGGAEVAYTASALQKEAAEFAQALASTNIPSQPSPPQRSLSGAPEPLATATPPHAPTNQND